jgi:voltage-gated potassium channel
MKQTLIHERKKLLISIERVLEGPMNFLGFVWLVLLVMELTWKLSRPLEYLSVTIWITFILFFILQLIVAPVKKTFFKKNWFVALSLIVPALRVFRVFRMFRLLKGLRSIRLIKIISSLNRTLKSLAATMKKHAFGYVMILTLIMTFAGAAGMYALENPKPGFDSYGMALWWTSMRVVTSNNEFNPSTPEGRGLALIITIFGYTIFGYLTASFASFFIGLDTKKQNLANETKELQALRKEVTLLSKKIDELKLR